VNAGNGGPAGSSFKVAPYNAMEYLRIYPGVDAMATNGLRYGAQTEIRENWSDQTYNSATPAAGSALNSNSNSSSAFTCTQTLYVRRAFVYLASDQLGILRMGDADGVIGIFDNGVTMFQNYDTGGWNGDLVTGVPGNVQAAYPFLSQQAADYGSTKVVYLSPQFGGFDFGLQWAPNNVNGEGPCNNAGSACPSLSSSSVLADGTRWMNEYELGARYQGTVGPVAIYAMAGYVGSGHVSDSAAAPAGAWNGRYNDISAGEGGIALTYAGFTIGGHFLGGQINNENDTNPQGAPQATAWLVGAQYATGPYVVGVTYYNYQDQGNPSLTHVSQRYTDALNIGATWNVAPGLYLTAEYSWAQMHQGDFNFVTGASGTFGAGGTAQPLENTAQAQVFAIGTKVRW
jgi:predicted porin